MSSGYDLAGTGLAERWMGIIKVRAAPLLADVLVVRLSLGSLCSHSSSCGQPH